MENEQSIYMEICEVSKQLEQLKRDIDDQRSEIAKCDSIIKPYQLAMQALNNSLNQLLKTKSFLKDKKLKLLNIISHNSDSDDEANSRLTSIKREMHENSTTESIASFTCNSIINETYGNHINPQIRTSFQSHGIVLNKQSTPIKENNFVQPVPISEVDIDKNKEISNNNSKEREGSCSRSCISVTDRKRKRKKTDSISSTKRVKQENDIRSILQFKNRKLSHAIKVSPGILFAGDKGLLQLRSLTTLDVIRKYIGHERGVISHMTVACRNRAQVILSSSGVNLIIFDMKTGECLFKEVFGSEITFLHSINETIFIALKSGSFYSFCLNKFSFLNVEKIIGTFVQSAIQIKMNGHLLNLMGCQDGNIYLPKTKQSDPVPIISNKRKNIYDLILLPGGSFILSYSDTTIDLYNKNTLLVKSCQSFKEEIKKVVVNDKNLYVLFRNGDVFVYRINKGLPNFQKHQKFETRDVTLKDIHVNEDSAILIGDENVYSWEF